MPTSGMHQEEFCCKEIIEAQKDIEGLHDEVASLEENSKDSHDKIERRLNTMDEKLEKIQAALANRVPTWATLLMTGMGTMLGVLVGVLATHGIK